MRPMDITTKVLSDEVVHCRESIDEWIIILSNMWKLCQPHVKQGFDPIARASSKVNEVSTRAAVRETMAYLLSCFLQALRKPVKLMRLYFSN